jgi:glycosyltransferase involved in cell wall biosynthesis
VPDYLALASIFVYASASETQGIVILEAMAAQLPVVAVNSSGIDAFVRHQETGLVTPENVELWTDALHRLLNDNAAQRSMGRAARSVARHYSVDAFASGAVFVYESALGSWTE